MLLLRACSIKGKNRLWADGKETAALESFFSDLAEQLSNSPVLQALVTALATLVLEDPVTIGSGLLVADGKMRFLTALVGLTVGIAGGDIGLYGIGRAFGPVFIRKGWIQPRRIVRARQWMRRNLISAIVTSRFVPGTRVPMYLGAGYLKASFMHFCLTALGATLAWTLLLLFLTVRLGELILPALGRMRWPLAGAALVFFICFQAWRARKMKQTFVAGGNGNRKKK